MTYVYVYQCSALVLCTSHQYYGWFVEIEVEVTLRLAVRQSVSQAGSQSMSWCRAPFGVTTKYHLLVNSYSLVHAGRPL
jgi:hypothetical protein